MIWLQNCTNNAITVANTMATLVRSGYPADKLVKGDMQVPPASRFTADQLRRFNLCGIYLREGNDV